jgi:hypothetical protein
MMGEERNGGNRKERIEESRRGDARSACVCITITCCALLPFPLGATTVFLDIASGTVRSTTHTTENDCKEYKKQTTKNGRKNELSKAHDLHINLNSQQKDEAEKELRHENLP